MNKKQILKTSAKKQCNRTLCMGYTEHNFLREFSDAPAILFASKGHEINQNNS